MDVEETLDLIQHLPLGSSFRSAHIEFGEWTQEQEMLADIFDSISRLTCMLSSMGTTEGAPLMHRPSLMRVRKAQLEKKNKVKDVLKNTEWEEVK